VARREQAVAEQEAALKKERAELEVLRSQFQAELAKVKHDREVAAANAARGPVPNIRADRCIVVDAKTGDILFEKNADKRGPVASTQKLLTSLIVCESGNMEDYLTVQESDTDCAPVRLGIKPEETYPRIQILTALLVKSCNDLAQALARDNAGSIEAFADKMNKRAAELGMTNSHFVNPHGLPAEDQYSTARDMARLALAADLRPEIRDIVTTRRFEFIKPDGKTIALENTNRVLRSDPHCDGMKTGFTEAAGHCLVCSGELDGRRRIVVVLNDTQAVWTDAQALLEWSLRY
jgi:D-alanyl-D-alanine carboxypeptidase (penicillin-binding protein 5/6)